MSPEDRILALSVAEERIRQLEDEAEHLTRNRDQWQAKALALEARLLLAEKLAEAVPQVLYGVTPDARSVCPCGEHESDKAHLVYWLAEIRRLLAAFRASEQEEK